MRILAALPLIIIASTLCAQTATPPKAADSKPAITDADRFHIRELEARLLQVDNQVKDWQLTGRPEAQKLIQTAYTEAQSTCKGDEQLDTTVIKCVVVAKKEPEEKKK